MIQSSLMSYKVRKLKKILITFLCCHNINLLASSKSLYEKFGDHFFKQKLYYRAITEYEKAYFLNSDAKMILKKSKSYYYGKQYIEAKKSLHGLLLQKNLDTQLFNDATYLRVKSLLQLGEYEIAITQLENLKGSLYDDESKFLLAHSYLNQGEFSLAEKKFSTIANKNKYDNDSQSILLELKNRPKQKSPKLASFLSLVPGAGQVYTGSYKVALASFVINAVLGYFTYSAYKKYQKIDHYGPSTVAGWGFLSLTFYLGNIYNAGRLASLKNEKEYQDFFKRTSVYGYNKILDE